MPNVNAHAIAMNPEVDQFPNEYLGDRAIWRAVLTQAALDAVSGDKKPEFIKAKLDASRWIRDASQDFVSVCDLAELDPRAVQDKLIGFMRRGGVWKEGQQRRELSVLLAA